MDKKSVKTNKYAAVITYLIALICLVLGLFLPLTAGKEILALQLTEVFNAVSGKQNEFILAYTVDFLGTGTTVDIMAWTVLVYAAFTALGVLALIPVLACKKHSKCANVCAYIIEVATAAALSVYLITALERFPATALSYNLIIALGGTLLMLVLQCLIYKRGSGAAKLILFLLSAVCVFALYDFRVLISPARITWAKIAEAMKSSPVLYGEVSGIGLMNALFEGNGGNALLAALESAASVKEKTLLMLAAITAALVLINYFIDLFSLATNGKKAGYAFNVFRYALEFMALICLYITLAFCKTAPGLLLYAITLALLIQLIISIVRSAGYVKYTEKAKLYSEESAAPVYEETETDYVPELPCAPVAEAEPVTPQIKETAAAVPAQAEPQVYKVNAVYQGPSDDFMRKLTNDEKIEFVMTFIEKSKGDLGNIPDYVIGGNNKKFFSSVFIYLGKVRCLISDALLNKMYIELNSL